MQRLWEQKLQITLSNTKISNQKLSIAIMHEKLSIAVVHTKVNCNIASNVIYGIVLRKFLKFHKKKLSITKYKYKSCQR